MPRTCTVCSHEKRAEIEAEIVSGKSYRVISRQFDVGHDSVQRHVADHHIAQEIKQSQAAKEEAQSLDVVKQLQEINTAALAIMTKAQKSDMHELALKAMDRVFRQLELQAKLLGELDERPQVNMWLMPEWYSIRSTIIAALTPYPDARIAVAGALSRLEHSRDSLN